MQLKLFVDDERSTLKISLTNVRNVHILFCLFLSFFLTCILIVPLIDNAVNTPRQLSLKITPRQTKKKKIPSGTLRRTYAPYSIVKLFLWSLSVSQMVRWIISVGNMASYATQHLRES